MECIVPGTNMKVFAKALQGLAKVGDELYMEAKKECFSLVSLNQTKTICARFRFFETFFSSYEVNQDSLKPSGTISCKIHLKIFLPLFRGNLEKKLEFFKLEYDKDSEFLVFKMKYKSDEILMVHKLRLMDIETLSIGVSTDSGCNNLAGSSSFYTQLLTMFSSTDEELICEISHSKVIVRNYCAGTPCSPKKIRTQISLNSVEFLHYRIKKETSINFSLKPFRTITSFAETFELDVEFNFDIGGRPLSFIIKNPTFEVNFIVATLDPYSESSSVASTPLVAPPISQEASHNWDEVTSKESSFLVKRNDDEILLPESPRTKRTKFIFGRCSDKTFHETVLGEVMVAESDTED